MKRKNSLTKSPKPPLKKQNTADSPPLNRVPISTHPAGMDGFGSDTLQHPTSPIFPSSDTALGNSTITKQAFPSLTLSAPQPMSDVDTPHPEPEKDRASHIQTLAARIMSLSEEGSEPHRYATRMAQLAETAGKPMRTFSIEDLTLMAKIVRGRPTHTIRDPDPTIKELTDTVKSLLIASRPEVETYELPGAKKVNQESVPTDKQISDTTDWLDTVQPILAADGFNSGGELTGMRQNIDSLLKTIGGKGKGSNAAWAELRGYIFQVNQFLGARSKYLLRAVERGVAIPGTDRTRYPDSVELLFTGGETEPTLCLCDYKGYSTSQKEDKEISDSFQRQLNDYVRVLQNPGDTHHLRYVFSGYAPNWVFDKLRDAAKDLQNAKKKVYLTQKTTTTVVGEEQGVLAMLLKPRGDLSAFDSATPPAQPPTKTVPKSAAVVVGPKNSKPEKRPPSKNNKQPEVKIGPLNSYFSKVHPPASTPQPGGRPSSTSNPGSTSK